MNATACGAQHAFPAPRRTPTRPAVRAAKGKISGSAGTSRKRPSVQRCCRAPCQKDARGAAIGRAACDPRFAASFRACLSSRGLRASSRLRLDCAGRPVSPDAPRYIPNLPLVVSPNWPPSSASCIPRSPASRCLGRRSSASATLPTVLFVPRSIRIRCCDIFPDLRPGAVSTSYRCRFAGPRSASATQSKAPCRSGRTFSPVRVAVSRPGRPCPLLSATKYNRWRMCGAPTPAAQVSSAPTA